MGNPIIFKIASKTNSRCFYCNKQAQVVEHFIPKRYLRENNVDTNLFWNLLPACVPCNAHKSGKYPDDFYHSYKMWDRLDRINKKFGFTPLMVKNGRPSYITSDKAWELLFV